MHLLTKLQNQLKTFADHENDYNIETGFADGNGHGGYLGNI